MQFQDNSHNNAWRKSADPRPQKHSVKLHSPHWWAIEILTDLAARPRRGGITLRFLLLPQRFDRVQRMQSENFAGTQTIHNYQQPRRLLLVRPSLLETLHIAIRSSFQFWPHQGLPRHHSKQLRRRSRLLERKRSWQQAWPCEKSLRWRDEPGRCDVTLLRSFCTFSPRRGHQLQWIFAAFSFFSQSGRIADAVGARASRRNDKIGGGKALLQNFTWITEDLVQDH